MPPTEIGSLEEWRVHLQLSPVPQFTQLSGWSAGGKRVPTFVEPKLRLRSDLEAEHSSIWLVSAPGAVGKSTYALELAAEFGMVLVDLSVASPVAGNYLSGGLVATRLVTAFQANALGIVIDALDEAKLRVTGESYTAFIEDIARLSKTSASPIVLFGREGAIEDAWLAFDQCGLHPTVHEIQRFDKDKAVGFVMARLDVSDDVGKLVQQFRGAYQAKVSKIIDQLAALTEEEGVESLQFAGYAPVLEAVAEYAAGISNPMAPLDLNETGLKLVDSIIHQVLVRESGKVRQPVRLQFPDFDVSSLYNADEQRRILVSRFSGNATKLGIVSPSPAIQQAYEDAALGLLESHPFVSGTGRFASSAVFEADLLQDGMKRGLIGSSVPVSLQRFAKPGNPFLIDLYLTRASADDLVPPEHLGYLFASAQALASAGQIAEFVFMQDDDESVEVDVEIALRAGSPLRDVRIWRFRSHAAGSIDFLSSVENVFIAGDVNVTLGSGQTGAAIVAPTEIDCATLTVRGSQLFISKPLKDGDKALNKWVVLGGEKLESNEVERIRVSEGVKLSINFPEASDYPWAIYMGEETVGDVEQQWDKKLALGRILGVFRADSSGVLSQSYKKMESKRMIKGRGAEVRDALVRDGFLRIEGRVYVLDKEAVADALQTSYVDVSRRQFGAKVDDWLRSV